MSEAPERIWAFPKKDWFNAGASTHKITTAGAKDVEYVRADLVEAIVRAAWERAADRLLLSIPEDAHPESIIAFVLRDRAEIVRALADDPAEMAAILKKAGEDRDE
jgi:hypothetical protein